LTRPDKVKMILEELLFDWELIAKDHVFFEDLFAFRIAESREKQWLKSRIKGLKFLARGRRGIVFTGIYRGKKVAIKIKRKSSEAFGRIDNEARMLKIVNRHGLGPKLRLSAKGIVVYDFVPGEYLQDWLPKASKSAARKILCQLLDQAFALDQIKISKEEMLRPLKNAIVTRKKALVLIDFERSHKDRKPHNVTQVCQFLRNWRDKLQEKGLRLDLLILEAAAKEYARNPCKAQFGMIKKLV
jgi:putative serine/threonine protein kinase